mmetsp:Transcript_22965/g.55634  ORF Transcript_22965/g.55634 Transcript_22965/m.55634 type:complete len:141 (+) Transcript_22965:68-490(+)
MEVLIPGSKGHHRVSRGPVDRAEDAKGHHSSLADSPPRKVQCCCPAVSTASASSMPLTSKSSECVACVSPLRCAQPKNSDEHYDPYEVAWHDLVEYHRQLDESIAVAEQEMWQAEEEAGWDVLHERNAVDGDEEDQRLMR